MKTLAGLLALPILPAKLPAAAEDREERIPLDQVPEKVVRAAVEAVPGDDEDDDLG